MNGFGLIALAMMAVSAPAAPTAEAAPHRYEVQIRLFQSGKLIASPRLVTEAGAPAKFLSDDGEEGWSVEVAATPDPARAGIAVATDVAFWSHDDRRRDSRRVSTTMLVNEGQPAAFELAPQGAMPSMRVEISLNDA